MWHSTKILLLSQLLAIFFLRAIFNAAIIRYFEDIISVNLNAARDFFEINSIILWKN